jgi:hypothetical protein
MTRSGNRSDIMFNQKPVITLRKEDETAFINVRTYWELTAHIGRGSDERCYDLRIKHAYPEDEFTFWFVNRAEHDDLELITEQAYAERRQAIVEHEGQGTCDACEAEASWRINNRYRFCDTCAKDFNDEPEVSVDILNESDALNRADALLADKVRTMDKSEEKVLAELRRHWDAFVLLFNPAINTF